MKHLRQALLIVFTFFCAISVAAEKPVILSGFDDVLRQAENTGLIKAAIKILEKDKTFTGMPELYTVLSKERTEPKFFLVSAISSMFDNRIDRFLKRSQFPSNQRYLRNWLTEWSIEDFKIEKIEEILAQEPQKRFIVIFDNSDASILLAGQLKQKFPNEILDIYLRQVVKKELPEAATGFYTAFDLAMHEYRAQRISLSELEEIGKVVLKEDRREALFPTYAICPKEYNPCGEEPTDANILCSQVRTHVQWICNK